MPVADSGGPYVYATFAGDTRAVLIAGIRDQLVAAGWSAAAVTGGWQLTGASPQGLSVKVKVWDHGQTALGQPQVSVQFSSASATGTERRLRVGAGYVFQAVANPCQFFLSRPSLAQHVDGSVVCGGVPWVPESACEGSTAAEAATEAWWAMGDCYESPFFTAGTPRVSLMQYAGPNRYSGNGSQYGIMGEAVWNGVYTPTVHNTGIHGEGVPTIVAITHPSDIDNFGGVFNPFECRWYGEGSVIYEPLVAWGETIPDAPTVRGQIWDAIVASRDYPMDVDETAIAELQRSPYDERSWINFTDRQFWGSLWLIRGGPATGTTKRLNFIY